MAGWLSGKWRVPAESWPERDWTKTKKKWHPRIWHNQINNIACVADTETFMWVFLATTHWRTAMYAINCWWRGNEVLLRWKSNEFVLRWIRNERLLRNAYALFLGQVVSFLVAFSSFFTSSVIDLGNFLFFVFSVFCFWDCWIIFAKFISMVVALWGVFLLGVCRCECASHPEFLRLSVLSSGFWDYQAG